MEEIQRAFNFINTTIHSKQAQDRYHITLITNDFTEQAEALKEIEEHIQRQARIK